MDCHFRVKVALDDSVRELYLDRSANGQDLLDEVIEEFCMDKEERIAFFCAAQRIGKFDRIYDVTKSGERVIKVHYAVTGG